ncbi:LysR family transcriptional regulator [Proteus sp. GOKU]|uniref:LysR family transcriptional regulator n=1 Tax=Proteus TaxID=583 RepID=UPI001892D1CB|nr:MULTISPECIES: LysR family transcriptional regulator [Proteus]QPB78732.1 LysR family transcriptional regulator [Proteus sp. GOKU]QQP24739.1 LysR family transcriptional regulator [Proteus vulgaris]WPC99962.1 LysR family transcriptional regulator [Proteus terrae]
MKAPFNWRHIEIFHAVMTTQNLTEAAELLKTSQPTVSRELSRLEHLLAFKLFDRIKGRLQPTTEGLRFFEEVQRSYYGLDRIINAAENIRHFNQAELNITCLPAFAQSLLPSICRQFLDKYPDVNLTIVPQESPLLEEWLSAQHYDLGLVEHTQTPAGTRQETILTLNEVAVLPKSHPLCKKPLLYPTDFQNERFISLSANDSYRQLIDTVFIKNRIARQLVMETQSAASICAMVSENIGISIVNPITALDYLDKSICLRPLSFTIPFTISLITPSHRPSSQLVTYFIDVMKEILSDYPKRLTQAFTR